MAFNPSGTNYAAMLESRRRSDEGVTRSLKAKGERDRAARVKASGKRSGLQKLVSAGVRGAAAYYTGGMSESMGFGDSIDSVMLGTDSEGNPVRNEYGDLVKTGSAVYTAGMSMKEAKLNKQDAKFDKLREKRMGVVDKLFDAGMDDKAMEGLKKIENMETGYMSKRKDMEGGWNPFEHSQSDYSAMQPQGASASQRAAQEAQLNQAAKGSTGTSTIDAPRGSDRSGPELNQQPEAPRQEQPKHTMLPPSQRAIQGPNISEMVDRQAKAKKAQQDAKRKERISALPGSEPSMYGDARRKDRLDMSGDLLSPEERRRAGMHGAFTGLKGTNRFME